MERELAILPGYTLQDFLQAPEHAAWGAETQDVYRRALRELYHYLQVQGPPGRDTLAAGPVFISSRGRTINRSNLCRSIQELCRDAGVDEAKGNPRALRSLYQATQADIQARMELVLRQAYDVPDRRRRRLYSHRYQFARRAPHHPGAQRVDRRERLPAS